MFQPFNNRFNLPIFFVKVAFVSPFLLNHVEFSALAVLLVLICDQQTGAVVHRDVQQSGSNGGEEKIESL